MKKELESSQGGKNKMENETKTNKLEETVGTALNVLDKVLARTIKYAIPGSLFYELGKQVEKNNPVINNKGEWYLGALVGETLKGIIYYNLIE